MPLEELQHRALTRHYRWLLAEGGSGGRPLSLRSVQYAHSILHKALADAVRDGFVATNPCVSATLPRIDPREAGRGPKQLGVWTAEQLAAFPDHTRGQRLHPLWQLAARTGMRRGELLGLTWADVDLDRGTIAVRRALSLVRRRAQLKDTKTGRPRTLTIDPVAIATLRDRAEVQRRERYETGPCWGNDWDLVFTSPTGAHLTPDVGASRGTSYSLDGSRLALVMPIVAAGLSPRPSGRGPIAAPGARGRGDEDGGFVLHDLATGQERVFERGGYRRSAATAAGDRSRLLRRMPGTLRGPRGRRQASAAWEIAMTPSCRLSGENCACLAGQRYRPGGDAETSCGG